MRPASLALFAVEEPGSPQGRYARRPKSLGGRLAVAVAAFLVVAGCGGGGGSDSPALTPSSSPPPARVPRPPPPSSTAASYNFPLKSSTTGRYLVDQMDRPFFIVGGSPQLIAHLSMTDAATYLSARAAQGFNTIQMYSLPWDFDHYRSLPGGNGAYPFTSRLGGGRYTGDAGTADFSTPNPEYFAYLDEILDLATSYGFHIHLYTIDFGYGGDGRQGWWLDVNANSAVALTSLGVYLGSRYKDRANVIWVDGSDYGQSSPNPPDSDNESKVVGLIQAMQAAGALQLRTGDWNAPSLSTDEPLFANLMQVNGIYSYGGIFPETTPNDGVTYVQSRAAWNYRPVAVTQGNPGATSRPPALPAYMKETDYEHSAFSPGDRASVRSAELWSVLSGATAGVFYENEHVLHMSPGWQQEMDSPGALDMGHIADLFQAYAWWKLVPSELSGLGRLVTSSNGTQSGRPNDYVAAAQAGDGTFLFAYVPPAGSGSQTLTLDLRSMSGSARARWWDPTTGQFSDATNGEYSLSNTTANASFAAPGNNTSGANDWILVLDTQ